MAKFPIKIMLPLAVLLVSFTVFLCLNPSSVLPRTTLYFDASRYLDSTKRLYEIMQALLAGQLTQGHLESLSFYLMLDGPVLPAAGALAFFIAQKFPSQAEWPVLIVLQCAIQSLGCLFIFLLSRRLFQNTKYALIAAFAWMTYPPAITSCNTFLTEPLSCTLSVAMIYFLSYMVPEGETALCGLQMLKPSKDNSSKTKPESSESTVPTDQKERRIHLACYFIAGTLWGMFGLLKPALLPVATLVFAIAIAAHFFCGRISPSRLIGPLTAISGVLVILLPWVIFGFITTKQVTLIPSRRPVYNVLQGCNLEGDGWSWYPTHPFSLTFSEEEPAPGVAAALINRDPAGFANLALRKITRFWNIPWNDYRYKVMGLTFKLQAIYQSFLALSAIAGMIVLISQLATGKYKSREIFIGLSVIFLALGHLIYLLFEAISRYGFTSMPFMIICAVFLFKQAASGGWKAPAGLFVSLALCISAFKIDPTPFLMELVHNFDAANTIQLAIRVLAIAALTYATYKASNFGSKDSDARKAFAILATVGFLIGSSVCGAFAVSKNATHMWAATLKDNWQIERSVYISEISELSSPRSPDWALLLIDGNENIPQVSVSVNDEPVKGTISSIYQFDSQHYDLEDWLNQFASLIRRPPDTLSRWRAIEVPLKALKKGWNKLTLKAPEQSSGKITIYGDYKLRTSNDKIVIPFWQQVSPGKFFNDSDEVFDSRIAQETYSKPSPCKSSFPQEPFQKRGDLSSSPGLQTGEYRVFLMLGYANDPKLKLQEAPSQAQEVATGPNQNRFEVRFDDVPSAKFGGYSVSSEKPIGTNLSIPESVMSKSHLKVVIMGEARTDSGPPGNIAVSGIVSKKDEFIPSILPGTPQLLNTSNSWSPFIVSSELPSAGLRGHSPILRVELKTSAGNAFAKNLSVQFAPLEKPQIKGHSIHFY